MAVGARGDNKQDESPRAPTDTTGPWCGTPGGYTNHKCRCGRCRSAWAADRYLYMHANPARLAAKARQSREKNAARKASK